MRQAVGLRGYAQRDPLHEYKSEAFQLFEHMLGRLRKDVTGQLMHVVLTQRAPEEFADMELPQMQAHHFDPVTGEDEFQGEEELAAPQSRQERRAAAKTGSGAPLPTARKGGGRDAAAPGSKGQQPKGRGQRASGPSIDPGNPSSWGKVARNAPCPCGSGKKFKHCHGAIASAAAE